ncbi:hypothetical protein CBG25_01985 [Arsenophonus sp. ENCA]|nr:hypothetical protein CBG25_01985 [Arsenophonus sp. ENCA]
MSDRVLYLIRDFRKFNEKGNAEFPFFLSISARSLCQKIAGLSIKTMKKGYTQIALMGYWLLRGKIKIFPSGSINKPVAQ